MVLSCVESSPKTEKEKRIRVVGSKNIMEG